MKERRSCNTDGAANHHPIVIPSVCFVMGFFFSWLCLIGSLSVSDALVLLNMLKRLSKYYMKRKLRKDLCYLKRTC